MVAKGGCCGSGGGFVMMAVDFRIGFAFWIKILWVFVVVGFASIFFFWWVFIHLQVHGGGGGGVAVVVVGMGFIVGLRRWL